MNILFLIGRILLGGFFLVSGINHFMNLGMMAGYAKMKGTPAPELAVGGTGAMLAVGGLSVLLGFYPVIGVWILVVFLLGVTFTIHSFWTIKDAQAKMADRVNFMKNLAILGALLMLLMLQRPWPWSLGGH